MPQPCILLKIQHIHYRFTWEKKGESCQIKRASTAMPIINAGMCTGMKLSLICQSWGTPASPGPSLISPAPDQSSLSCKITTARPFLSRNTSRKLQGNDIFSLKRPSVGQEGSEAHYAQAVEGKGSQRTSFKPSHHSQQWWELKWWILKGKLCILNNAK